MCAIFGYKNSKINEKFFFDLMKHRGPDAKGIVKHSNWTLGHMRLSIIDKSANSNQPFEKDGSTIILNGEIYNYLELKNEYLPDSKFTTSSDTEVLIMLLNKYGVKILNKLNGMFAFAYLNKDGELFLVRDRYGVKPLYYSQINDSFYFASELNPLISNHSNSSIDKKEIKSYLEHTITDIDDKSGFTDIYSIKPGYYILINKDTIFNQKQWYQIPKTNNINLDKYEIINQCEKLLLDSIKIRCRADVPIALTLSGGVDSSLIYTLIKEKLDINIKPFIFRHNNTLTDESKLAINLTKKYGDNPIIVSQDNMSLEDVKKTLCHLEFPMWSPSAISYYSMYKKIAEKGFKVVIEGHGSDEQLGGYPYMIRSASIESLQNNKFNDYFLQRKIFLQTNHFGLGQKINRLGLLRLFFRDINDSFFGKKVNFQKVIEESFDKKILPMAHRTFDRLSMANSIESRMPFMDFRFVEFAKNLPTNMKISKIGNKSILREILKKYGHHSIYSNKSKMGFSSDIPELFKNNEFLEYITDLVENFSFENYSIKKKDCLKILSSNKVTWQNYVNIWKFASVSYLTKYKVLR